MNRYPHVLLILVLAASQIAASLHAVGHLSSHPQSDGHSQPVSLSASNGSAALLHHAHGHEHAHEHNTALAAPDLDQSVEPDCLLFHVYLNLCVIAAAQITSSIAPPVIGTTADRTPPALSIGPIRFQPIRAPPALS